MVFLLLLPRPPITMILLVTTAAWSYLSWLKRGSIRQHGRILRFTSKLRSESIHLAQCAKRCRKSWCPDLRMRPAADRFWRQRGSGRISLGRIIKGWEVTWFRKRRDVAVGRWESFNACFTSRTSGYYESCERKAVKNTINKWQFHWTNQNSIKSNSFFSSPVGQLSPWQVVAWATRRRENPKVRKTTRAIISKGSEMNSVCGFGKQVFLTIFKPT